MENKKREHTMGRKARNERLCGGLSFDMWDNGSGGKVIAVFLEEQKVTSDGSPQRTSFLLCLAPLINEATSNGDAQIEKIVDALGRIGYSIFNSINFY